MTSPNKNNNNCSVAKAPYLQHCEDFLVAIRSVHRTNNNPNGNINTNTNTNTNTNSKYNTPTPS
eukprot:UN07689